jgi:hypothetical protein
MNLKSKGNRIFVTTLLSTFLLIPTDGMQSTSGQGCEIEPIGFPHYAEGVVIIKLKPGVHNSSSGLDEMLIDIKGSLERKVFHHARPKGKISPRCSAHPDKCSPGRNLVSVDLTNIWLVRVSDPNTNIERLSKYIAANYQDLVEYAEPDYYVELGLQPDDPFYHSSGSWGQAYDDQWGLKLIDPECAWDFTTGDPGVTIAIVDTGIDYNHPDLANNIWINPWEIPDNGIDDDGNGYTEDIYWWDFAGRNPADLTDGDNDPIDYRGHGTTAASLAAGYFFIQVV